MNNKKSELINILSPNEQYLRAILETSVYGFWLVDSSQKLVYANNAYCKMSGYSLEELLQLSISDVDAIDDKNLVQERMNRLIEKGHETFESIQKRKDASVFYVEVSASYSPQDNRFVCFIRDITNRKLMEESLKRNEELLRNIIDSCADYIYVKDKELRTVICNKAFASAVGKKPDEMMGKNDIENGWDPEFVKGDHSRGIKGFEDDDLKALNGEVVHSVAGLGKVKNNVCIFDTIKLPFRNAAGEIIGLLGVSRDITERKKVEEQLRLLEFSVERSSVCVFRITPDGCFTYVNDATCRALGRSREELIGATVSDLDPNYPETTRAEQWKKIKNRGTLTFETEHRRKDGYIFPVEVTSHYLRFGDQEYEFAFATNITKRKKVEQALLENEKDMKRAQAIAQLGSWRFDLNTGKVIASDEAIKIYGLKDFPMTIKHVQTIPLPKYRKTLDTKLNNLIEKKEPYDIEFEIQRPSDNARRCIHSMAEYDPVKNVIYGVFQDITDRKLAEIALAAERERLAVTLRSIGDGVITTDIQGRITIMNKIAEEMTGWDQNEAQGRPLAAVFKIVDEFTGKPCEDPVSKVLSTGEIIELANHTVLISKKGTKRIIADSGAPIREKNGNILGVVLVFRDITEKQKFLETVQRTAKLDSLGVLAGGIAHDFNNLLGGILGYIDVAKTMTNDTDVVACLSKALSSIDRGRALTHQLLTFAKGGVPIKKLEELFPFVQETVNFALCGSSVASVFEIQNDLWMCEFDRNQIGQVIDNIIINAKQAMPDGGRVKISASNIVIDTSQKNSLRPGYYVKLSFEDQGIGMPKAILDKIFDPFYTTKSQGHGLGLATCYSIINKHGGGIDVESEPGKGTVFYIYIPASQKSSLPTSYNLQEKHTGTGRILVVDDEMIIRETISDMLSSFGYEIITKEKGEDALEFLTKEFEAGRSLIAMIFDLTIPGGLGGKQAISEVRKLFKSTPVFVISGYADDPIMSNPQEHGFTDSLPKPFKRIELVQLLNRHLKSDR